MSLRNLIRVLDPALDVVVMGVDRDMCSWIASARTGTAVTLVEPVPNKRSLARFLALRRAIVRLRPDVFHANLRTIGDARYALPAAISIRGVKVIAVEQLPLPLENRFAKWVNRRTSARLAAHVGVGQRIARIVEQEVGLPHGSILTIYNGVPDHGGEPEPDARSGTVLGTLARLDRVKGLDVLLDAAAGLSHASVLLIGEGPEREALRSQAERLGIAANVRFVAWSDNARDLLGEIDVFVLPSRNEGFPLSIVEAMLAARPVVATDVGSVREAVEDGVTGLLVPPDDVQALQAALKLLVGNPGLRRRMGDAGRERAYERFTDAVMGRAFEQLYDRVDPRPARGRAEAQVRP